jgi:hypothetical protein
MLDFYRMEEEWAVKRTQVYSSTLSPDLKSQFVTSIYQQPGAVLVMSGPGFTGRVCPLRYPFPAAA